MAQGEEGEVDGAVGAELLERGEGGEVVVLSVFEDEDAVGGKPFLAQDEGWELVEVSQSVGRVGEDQVERRNGWGVEIAKDIASHQLMAWARYLQLGGHVLDELLLLTSHLDADNMGGASAEQFEADAACAAKEVERPTPVDVHAVLEDVEQRLLGQIGGGPCLEVAGRVETTSAVLTCDDLHFLDFFFNTNYRELT